MNSLSLFVVVLLAGLTEISSQNQIRTDDEANNKTSLEYLPLPPLQSTRVLVPGYQEFTLVFKDITCRFRIRMKERDGGQHYKYRAGAYSGESSTEEGTKITTRYCAVFTCTGESIDTCGKRFEPSKENPTASFEELFVEATIPATKVNPDMKTYKSSFCPVSWNVTFLPLGPEKYDYFMEERDTDTTHILSLKTQHAELYSFVLLGRQLERDSDNLTLTGSFQDVKDREELNGDGGNWNVKICDDEREETQEDNDEGVVQNLKTFKNL